MCLRSVHKLPSDRRGAGEQEQAAASAGLGDRCSGLGHFQNGPDDPAADSTPGTPHHAAFPHPPRQVEPETAGNHELLQQGPERRMEKTEILRDIYTLDNFISVYLISGTFCFLVYSVLSVDTSTSSS